VYFILDALTEQECSQQPSKPILRPLLIEVLRVDLRDDRMKLAEEGENVAIVIIELNTSMNFMCEGVSSVLGSAAVSRC
jgi:hypothetical protein